ncbi:MAG: methyl-accepting chemotaxis protein [Deltaproteobacteria bacterium]|nr:methyl-accepting chemotaxis protein [Deltaproteobacteria bacterium]
MKNLTLTLKITLSFALVLMATLAIILTAIMVLSKTSRQAEIARAAAFELGFRVGQALGAPSDAPEVSEGVWRRLLTQDPRPDNAVLVAAAMEEYQRLLTIRLAIGRARQKKAALAKELRELTLAWASFLGRARASQISSQNNKSQNSSPAVAPSSFGDLAVEGPLASLNVGLGFWGQDTFDPSAYQQWLLELESWEAGFLAQGANLGLKSLRSTAGEFGRVSQELLAMEPRARDTGRTLFATIDAHPRDTGRAARDLAFGLTVGFLSLGLLTGLLIFYIYRAVIRPLRGVLGGLERSAGEVTRTARLLSRSSHSLGRGASDNTQAVLAAISSLEDLLGAAKRNADNSERAKKLMDKAKSFVVEANEAMDQISVAMEEIKNSGQASRQIIKSVEEIAFQTNILALNAAVEAARAGEAGVGFAVVADEVRNLANSSSAAARNTNDMLARSVMRINEGAQLVIQAGASFKDLVVTSEDVANLVQSVTEASQTQARAIQDTHQSIAMMDKVTQENAVEAAGAEKISRALNGQARFLSRAVQRISALLHGYGWASSRNLASPAEPDDSRARLGLSLAVVGSDVPAEAPSPSQPLITSSLPKVSKKALDQAIPMDDDF